jgi:hypothetical protein
MYIYVYLVFIYPEDMISAIVAQYNYPAIPSSISQALGFCQTSPSPTWIPQLSQASTQPTLVSSRHEYTPFD